MNRKNNGKSNILFTPSTIVRGNAVLNFLELPISEFPQYARSFQNAARKLAQKFADVQGYNDLEALPIVYLYRHAVELFLKGALIAWRRAKSLKDGESYDLKDLFSNHRLSPLLKDLREASSQCDWGWPPFIYHDLKKISLEDIVIELENVDEYAFSFRYPVQKNLKSTLPKHFIFHIYQFSDKMEATCHILDGVCMAFESEFDSICEAIDEIGR